MSRVPELLADSLERLLPRDLEVDEEFRVLASGPELWIALRHGADGLGRDLLRFHPGAPVLGGDLAELPASELFELVHRSGRSGALLVSTEGVERALLFRNGDAVWATSTDRRERVDELISRVDIVERAYFLRRCLGQDAAGIVREQVQRVALALLQARSGSFCLFRSPDRDLLPSLPALDTEALLGDCLFADAGD